jgi:lipoprotein NlpD
MMAIQSLLSANPARRSTGPLLTLMCVLVLTAGCATRGAKAPVEDRSANKPATPVATAPAAAQAPASAPATAAPAETAATKPPPGIENAGKPGYYAVKPGDTLIRIGLDSGQNWRDVARWNGLDNPNVIEVGQVLRVAPPPAELAAVTKPVAPVGRVDTKALDAKGNPILVPPAVPGAPTVAGTPTTTATGATPAAAAPAATTTAAREPDDELNWLWPANGPVATAFEEARNNGLDIVGKAGDAVVASADGRVIYAGAGIRGLGNLIILKHNNTYLTAYAHNQALFVKEEQAVKRGQKIAEMGSSDADRVQLHFEIRRRGKPIDPAKLLPPR